jgi:SAM-dependent methyltransferase
VEVGDVGGKHVLDAGCGPGLYGAELVSSGADVVAFDASGPMVELARARPGDRGEVHQAILGEPLQFRDHSFDLILCSLTIHYVDDRVAAFSELRRILRPGGALPLTVLCDEIASAGLLIERLVETRPA